MSRERWITIVATACAVLVVAVGVVLALRAEGSGGPGWQAPDPLPARSRVAATVAADGTVLAVWAERRDGEYVMRFAERPPGGPWGDGIDIGRPRHWQMAPIRLELNERGDAVVVFSLASRGVSTHQAAFRPAGGEWETPQTVMPVARDMMATAVALDERGGVTLAYTRVGRGRGVVRVVRRTSTGWKAPSTILRTATEGPAHGAALAVAAAGDGRAYVATATMGGRNARPRLALLRRDGSHRMLPPPPVTVLAGSSVALAVNAAGRPVAVWGQDDPGKTASVRTATLGADGRWGAVRVLDRGLAGAPGDLTAVNTGTGLLVAWARWRTPWTHVAVRASLAAGDESFATAATVDTYEVFDLRRVSGGSSDMAPQLWEPPSHMVTGRFGARYLLWSRYGTDPSGSGGELASSSARAGEWTPPEIVTPNSAWPIAVGAAGSDAAQAVWQQQGTRSTPALAADRRP